MQDIKIEKLKSARWTTEDRLSDIVTKINEIVSVVNTLVEEHRRLNKNVKKDIRERE